MNQEKEKFFLQTEVRKERFTDEETIIYVIRYKPDTITET
jgi:hypothetical protein